MDGSHTLATSIYARLRRNILHGVLSAGEKLRLDGLCERYEIGATPLREALNRLSADELVMREEQRGSRVAPVSLSDLEELTKTCCWISELALRKWMKERRCRLGGGRCSRGSSAVARSTRGPRGLQLLDPEWEERHRAFHLALIGACGSRWLIDFYATLMDRNTRYRYLAFADGSEPRDVKAEHQAIVAAVLARTPTAPSRQPMPISARRPTAL